MAAWVWEWLRDEAELLRGLFDDSDLEEPPAVLRVCRLTADERLGLLGAYALQAQLSRRVVALWKRSG
jgi:hypothetical protein